MFLFKTTREQQFDRIKRDYTTTLTKVCVMRVPPSLKIKKY